MDKNDGGLPDGAQLPDEPWGEIPSRPEDIPGVITVQETPQPGRLEEDAWQFLHEHPNILKSVRRLKQDVIAHKTEILIGAGVAGGLAAALGAIVIVTRGKRGGKK